MGYNKKTLIHKITKFTALIVPFILLSAVFFRSYLFAITEYFPKCWFYEATGWLCPACGNTRSVKALLKGDLITSLRYNIIPSLLCIIGGIFYIELLTLCFGRHKAIFPRSFKLIIVLSLLLALYFILRNFIHLFPMC